MDYSNPVAVAEAPPELEPVLVAAREFAEAACARFDADGRHLFQYNHHEDNVIAVVVQGEAADMLRPLLATIPPKED